MEVVRSSAFTQKNVRSVWFVVKRRGCCCNLSGGVALILWFTANGMCVKNNTNTIIYVARYYICSASNSKRNCKHDLYCCLLPQCEALRRCRSDFRSQQYSQTFCSHVPLQHFVIWVCTPKISHNKKTEENNKNIFTNNDLLILKIILTDIDLCINTSISKWIICKHNFSLPLLTSNMPFQIAKSTPRGTCTPGCEPLV